MRLSRAKLRTLIESIILENKGSRAPVPLTVKEVEEGNMIADIEAAIKKELNCGYSECVIKQTKATEMIFVGWKK